MMTIYDNVIMRTIIELPEEQVEGLTRLCAKENISRAEAIRRAVDALLRDQPTKTREAAFGAWKAQRRDSCEIVDELRGEW